MSKVRDSTIHKNTHFKLLEQFRRHDFDKTPSDFGPTSSYITGSGDAEGSDSLVTRYSESSGSTRPPRGRTPDWEAN